MNKESKAEGILLLNKPVGKTSFNLVSSLRRRLGVKKIGHTGTLDPFAEGVMVMLVGRSFTKKSDYFLHQGKEYIAKAKLGEETDTYDSEGKVIKCSTFVPPLELIEKQLEKFQGEIEQIPPMFSAKKQKGQPLYKLARKGEIVERPPCKIVLKTTLLNYSYPYLELKIECSKGTYIRSVAHDLGQFLQCGAHLVTLTRTRSGPFSIQECLDYSFIENPENDLSLFFRTSWE